MTEYQALQHKLAQGWNTWNTLSVLSHVLLSTLGQITPQFICGHSATVRICYGR
jgi:hypothetical protein